MKLSNGEFSRETGLCGVTEQGTVYLSDYLTPLSLLLAPFPLSLTMHGVMGSFKPQEDSQSQHKHNFHDQWTPAQYKGGNSTRLVSFPFAAL